MAIIIKADMPKDCYDCYINKNWTFDYICPLMEKGADLNTWLRADCRHPNCPIAGEIPDEYGRLIDTDTIGSKDEWAMVEASAIWSTPTIRRKQNEIRICVRRIY